MSMIGGIEASMAAGEILALIGRLETEYKDEPKTIEALKKVRKKAEEIKVAGDAGYY